MNGRVATCIRADVPIDDRPYLTTEQIANQLQVKVPTVAGWLNGLRSVMLTGGTGGDRYGGGCITGVVRVSQ